CAGLIHLSFRYSRIELRDYLSFLYGRVKVSVKSRDSSRSLATNLDGRYRLQRSSSSNRVSQVAAFDFSGQILRGAGLAAPEIKSCKCNNCHACDSQQQMLFPAEQLLRSQPCPANKFSAIKSIRQRTFPDNFSRHICSSC